jgi:putative membrane protein
MPNQTEAASAELSIKDAIAADASTRFSFERTLLSHERTLMSWIRTATSLITFGFTIYKFFQLELAGSVRPRISQAIGAREFAMIMITIGLVALVLATIQNTLYRQDLRKQQLKIPVCLSSVVGALISLLGVLALLAAIFRW